MILTISIYFWITLGLAASSVYIKTEAPNHYNWDGEDWAEAIGLSVLGLLTGPFFWFIIIKRQQKKIKDLIKRFEFHDEEEKVKLIEKELRGENEKAS